MKIIFALAIASLFSTQSFAQESIPDVWAKSMYCEELQALADANEVIIVRSRVLVVGRCVLTRELSPPL